MPTHGSHMTPAQTHALQTAVSLSMIGICYVLWHYIWRRWGPRKGQAVDFTSTLVFVLTWCDFAMITARMIGRVVIDHNVLCQFQGLVLQFTGLAGCVWTSCMAHNLYRWIVRGDSETKLRSRFYKYLVISIVPAASLAVYDLAAHLYGEANIYCWIVDKGLRFTHFYTWYGVAIVFNTTLLLLVQFNVRRRLARNETLEADVASSIIRRKLFLYIVVFICHRTPAMIYRLAQLKGGGCNYTTTFLVNVILNLEGLSNSIVYGGFFLSRDKKKLLATQAHETALQMSDGDSNYGSSHFGSSSMYHQALSGDEYTTEANELAIFTSTFNMAEQNVSAEELTQWIPLGYEVYVFGVQECMDLDDFRNKVMRHLASRKPYVHYSREIGNRTTALGYHGFIGIMLFVDENAVSSGRFQMPPSHAKQSQELNRGKSLMMFGRTSNKGGVGLAFRYNSASFAFVTCHLASDSAKKAAIKSKIERRNEDAREILQNLYLHEEDYGFGFPMLHHYSFVLGDFNYRMTRQKKTPTEMIGLLREVGQPMNPEVSITVNAATEKLASMDMDRYAAVDTPKATRSIKRMASLIHEHDELHQLMEEDQVFSGFEEPEITFYPTFRRIRGQRLDTTQQQPPPQLESNYTLQVANGGHRVPSFTDRILFMTLPGMRERVKCDYYESCEAVTSSDHKPVSALFRFAVGAPKVEAPSVPMAATSRMKDVPGSCEMRLTVEYRSLEWVGTADQPSMDAADISLLFPLPSEDAFAQHRKLHEVAAALTGSTSEGDHGSNIHVMKWRAFTAAREGVRYRTYAKASGMKHVAVSVRLPPVIALSAVSNSAAPAGPGTTAAAAAQPGAAVSFVNVSQRSMTSLGTSIVSTPTSISSSNSTNGDAASSSTSSSGASSSAAQLASERLIGQGTFCVEERKYTRSRKQVVVPLTVGGRLVAHLHLVVALRVMR
ncbi:TPA: hypothetical protein N0F65_005321 [Lagenidium giganteum]|uniref:Inositol polyphosphate-related phosphatase domain-containing protein n=1 Tax=Lagenidium giganteum TaxID=4803 RepID=A0AAV2Z0B1_9STRA|nr:TPA: hypothetical protein N0F65_005321 [Lagenidium giganteum]